MLNFFYFGFLGLSTEILFHKQFGFPKLHTIITLHLTSFRSSIPSISLECIYKKQLFFSILVNGCCRNFTRQYFAPTHLEFDEELRSLMYELSVQQSQMSTSFYWQHSLDRDREETSLRHAAMVADNSGFQVTVVLHDMTGIKKRKNWHVWLSRT